MEEKDKMKNLAVEMALKVGFLTTSEELVLYSSALYLAMEWGKKVGNKKGASPHD